MVKRQVGTTGRNSHLLLDITGFVIRTSQPNSPGTAMGCDRARETGIHDQIPSAGRIIPSTRFVPIRNPRLKRQGMQRAIVPYMNSPPSRSPCRCCRRSPYPFRIARCRPCTGTVGRRNRYAPASARSTHGAGGRGNGIGACR